MGSNTPALPPDDRRSLSLRLSGLQAVVATAFAALAVAFWVFQVAQHQKFDDMAENNHRRRLPLPAPRGVLFDRNGKVLVENQNTFNIALVREQSGNIDETLRILAAATGADEAKMRETVNRRRREPSYRPIVLIENASIEQVIAFRARRLELPGIISQEVPARQYPQSEMGAHLFGYVSEASEADLAKPEYTGAESGSMVGKAGIEQSYNKLLMGKDGDRLVVVNSRGREMGEASHNNPVEGRRVQLTIDGDVQRATEEGFEHFGYNGAAVILDPRSGEVLAFTSLPAYDPNHFAGGIDVADWNSLLTNDLKPLQNRALQGRYSPGSTFKIAVATAALEEGLVTPDFRVFCPGGATFYGRYFQCHLKGGHGSVDMRHAIEKSCNVYFYTLGKMLEVDRIHKWATLLGLGERSGIDLPASSKVWCRQPSGSKRRASRSGTRARRFRCRSARDRSRDADFAGGDDDDDRQRRHALYAARRQGGRRRQGLGTGSGAATAVDCQDEAVDDRRAARRPLDGRQRRGHRRPRSHPELQRRGQDGNGAGDFARRRQSREGQDGRS